MDLKILIKDMIKTDEMGRCTNAFKILSNPQILLQAYNNIKSKPGNMVPGSDNVTLDGISSKELVTSSINLLNESYKPNPVRRVFIPKANGKLRPLGISSPRDKIIQQAFLFVLETILEPKFSDLSHGFRPNRGCHTALRNIRDWKGVPWFIEGDIKGFFDNIDHQILANLLLKHFNEARLIHLYWKFVKAGYVEWDNKKFQFVASEVGVPQGSIISPILSNLILHELDKYIESIIDKSNNLNKNSKPYIANTAYNKLTMRISRMKGRLNIIKAKGERHLKSYPELYKKYIRDIKDRKRLKSLVPNPKSKPHIKYVRYADDWLIGVWGNRKFASDLRDSIQNFLSDLKLELSIEKTLITNSRSQRAKFLGVYIKRAASKIGAAWMMKSKTTNEPNRRTPTGNLWMTAPILEIVKKLEKNNFLTTSKSRWNPKPMSKFLMLPTRDIILRYKSIFNGYLNYYSFADNKPLLKKIHWILKESLRKTLCRKLQISKKIFLRRFGKDILVTTYKKNKTKYTSFSIPALERSPMFFLGGARFTDPLDIVRWKIYTINPFEKVCSSCGSTSDIEMHHIKHIRTINLKLESFDKKMASINRKQVPLCRNCHNLVHAGKYQGLSLKHL
uniref:Reverse transcriptase domain-containing protein n=1 Tax=Monilinia fructicola TaxID=38448 RepID=A0A889XQ37_MONFR|nr:hypothetical protein KQ509_mgp22 [Monilinia fructicola]QRF72245.1 hypothetical protein [Monilinia fructicola]